MQLVEVDALDTEREAAGLARGPKMCCSSVLNPIAARPDEPALGRDANSRSVPGPGRERTGDEALVVAGFVSVEAIRVGRIEQRDSGIEGRMDHGDRPRVVAVALCRQAHAAQRDARHGGWSGASPHEELDGDDRSEDQANEWNGVTAQRREQNRYCRDRAEPSCLPVVWSIVKEPQAEDENGDGDGDRGASSGGTDFGVMRCVVDVDGQPRANGGRGREHEIVPVSPD